MRKLALYLALMLAPPAFADEPVELTFIANEGVLLEWRTHAVLIDSPASNSYDGTYSLPSTEIVEAMVEQAPPFQRVSFILSTHIHGDHFDAATLSRMCNKLSSNGTLLGSNAAIDAYIVAGGHERCVIRPSVNEDECGFTGEPHCRAEYGATLRVSGLGPEFGIDIDARPLFHREEIEHWTYRVEMGGVSVLHLGDTQPQMADFSIWDGVDFDVILYPYWFLQMAEGVAFLEAHPEARTIAFHIPAAATDAEIMEALDGAEYLHTEGETRILSAAPHTNASE